jgi:ubiquinone/menaquinone biosynthesis C-methylase UbiE
MKIIKGYEKMVAEKITQCMKPHGEEGYQTIENMNENHKEISDFAFECVNVGKNDRILDIGCGGGVNIEKFLKLTSGNVDGLDYSEVSVNASIRQNQNAVESGRCEVIQADVSDMPIDDESYDLVSAFETIYFWPDIENTFKEVSRIIKPQGQFMIAQGTDGNHPDDELWLSTVEGMSVYTADELEKYLLNAGFESVKSFKKENDYILIVIAKK